MNADQNSEVWKRLIQGKALNDLGLNIKDGRFDLVGLLGPDPEVFKRFSTNIADVAVLSGGMKFERTSWKSLDFTGSRLNGLRFFSCMINNCIFEECSCQNLGLWGTTVSNTSFKSSSLLNSTLGGVQDNRVNTFDKVDFTKADLRQTAYVSAKFIGCVFKNTRLDKVNFQGSAFTDCFFEGELREVIFNRKGFRADAFPPNEMLRVDFAHAQLRSVEFRGLDLEEVRFPTGPDYILLNE